MTDPATHSASAASSVTHVDSWHLGRMFAAWIFAAAFGLIVTMFTPEAHRFEWLAVAVGASVLFTFALQLGTAQREGFITRTSFSVAGATVIIAVIDLVGLFISGRTLLG